MKGLRKLIYRYKQFKSHPLAKGRIWQIMLRYVFFNLAIGKKEKIYRFIGGLKFYATKGDAGIVANVYTGLYDFEEMSFLLHYLKENDIFIDVGANVGEYSLLASGMAKARSFAYEPIHSTFEKLSRNIILNKLEDKVTLRNKGVSSKSERLCFTINKGVMNHVSSNKNDDTVEVMVESLDESFIETSADLIKIDVEGHENEVLSGAHKVLSSERLQALIIEINNRATQAGYSPREIHEQLLNYGFYPVAYLPFERSLIRLDDFKKDQFNTIYIKNIDSALERLKYGKDIGIFGFKY